MHEASTSRQQPSFVAIDGRDRSDRPGYPIRANGKKTAVRGDCVAIDTSGEYVHT
jgi:hypothetical protein